MSEPEVPGTAISPPMGPRRQENFHTCGYNPSMVEGNECGKPTVWHIIWTADGENGAACDEHYEGSKERWAFMCAHQVGVDCFMPNSIIVWDENRCVVEGEPIGGPLLSESVLLPVPALGADTPATKATGDLDDCWDKAYDAKLERGYQARRAAKRGKPAGIADTPATKDAVRDAD